LLEQVGTACLPAFDARTQHFTARLPAGATMVRGHLAVTDTASPN
jgi:hypothetical protein